MTEIINIETKNNKAQICSGELVSFEQGGIQYIHGGGKPADLKQKEDYSGWQKSEIIMFPIVGAVVGYKVRLEDRFVNHDIHGISNAIEFVTENQKSNSVQLVQRYDGVTPIKNPNYKPRSACPEYLEWPFKYELRKSIELTETGIKISISLTNKSSIDMPYMLGFHPAFRTLGKVHTAVFVELSGESYTLEEVIKESIEGNGALFLKGVERLSYENTSTKKGFEFVSGNFNNIMMWSPGKDSGMFCIEPITNLPEESPAARKYFVNKTQHKIIEPEKTKDYWVEIKPRC
jgi:galactose mutarotase-like enzyme